MSLSLPPSGAVLLASGGQSSHRHAWFADAANYRMLAPTRIPGWSQPFLVDLPMVSTIFSGSTLQGLIQLP